MSRRVVITGTGLLTALGKDVQSSWASLLAGTSGAGPITQFDASDFAVRFACEVKDFEPAEYIDRKEVKRTDRYAQFALAAISLAKKVVLCSRLCSAFDDVEGFRLRKIAADK